MDNLTTAQTLPQLEIFTGIPATPPPAEYSICGRPISSPESLRVGIGSYCRRANKSLYKSMETTRSKHRTIDTPITDGIVFDRDNDGRFGSNVPYLYETGGSPDGFETGYLGSGPSELALNAVQWILQVYGPEPAGVVAIKNGTVSVEAWKIRHTWKELVIAYVKPPRGKRIVVPISVAAMFVEIAGNKVKCPVELDWSKIPGGRDAANEEARIIGERLKDGRGLFPSSD